MKVIIQTAQLTTFQKVEVITLRGMFSSRAKVSIINNFTQVTKLSSSYISQDLLADS